MRPLALLVTSLLLLGGCRPGAAAHEEDAPQVLGPGLTAGPTGFDIDAELHRMVSRPLWPGYDPLATPLAIFDGRHTLLLRHPAPPPTYHSLSRSPEMWLRVGRDGMVTANTSVLLGGVQTATMMISPADRRAVHELAGIAVHELFHVHQERRHPGWTANEADLFTYPFEDAGALALRRAETEALRRALAAPTADSAACWGGELARLRAQRFARLGRAASAYERGTELREGMARYVEQRATGAPFTLPVGEFVVEDVRLRAYDLGAGLGLLLDRLATGWRDTLEATPDSARLTLDGLLDTALARRPHAGGPACALPAEWHARAAERATRDVTGLETRRASARATFLAASGWRIVIDAPGAPLFPQGFDPLNVRRVSPAEILHSRFVTLGGSGAKLQVIGRATLTQGTPGGHPLFNGVRRVTVTGLAGAPSMSDSAGVVLLRADGVEGAFPKARVQTEGQEVRVTLP